MNENTLFIYDDPLCSYQYSSVNLKDNYVSKMNEKGEIDFDYVYIGVSYIKNFDLFFNYLNELYVSNSKK